MWPGSYQEVVNSCSVRNGSVLLPFLRFIGWCQEQTTTDSVWESYFKKHHGCVRAGGNESGPGREAAPLHGPVGAVRGETSHSQLSHRGGITEVLLISLIILCLEVLWLQRELSGVSSKMQRYLEAVNEQIDQSLDTELVFYLLLFVLDITKGNQIVKKNNYSLRIIPSVAQKPQHPYNCSQTPQASERKGQLAVYGNVDHYCIIDCINNTIYYSNIGCIIDIIDHFVFSTGMVFHIQGSIFHGKQASLCTSVCKWDGATSLC